MADWKSGALFDLRASSRRYTVRHRRGNTTQTNATRHEHSYDHRKHQQVTRSVHPQQPMRPELAEAETIKPNHVEKGYRAGCAEYAIECAGIAGFHPYDLYGQRGESSPTEALRNHVQHRTRQIHRW